MGRCDTPARTQVGAKDFDQAISELEELNWYLCHPLSVMYNSSTLAENVIFNMKQKWNAAARQQRTSIIMRAFFYGPL